MFAWQTACPERSRTGGTWLEEQNPSGVRLGIRGHGRDPHLENREMWGTPSVLLFNSQMWATRPRAIQFAVV